MPSPSPIPPELLKEGERVMRLCNACRYCEGYCAVFPAMERRTVFAEKDLAFLANLCHDCNECYYACPYSPPHEFALNLPQTLGKIRTETYRKYAWPGVLSRLFDKSGVTLWLGAVAGPVLFLMAMLLLVRPPVLFSAHAVTEGSFYAVMSQKWMTLVLGFGFLGAVIALAMGYARFWRDMGGQAVGTGALGQALWDALRLRYLEGGGDGCAYPGELPSNLRRRFHHLTFYGFMLCFAATTVAAIDHYVFGWDAPYPFLSAPVILGIIGGLGLLIGPVGLLWIKGRRNPELTDPNQTALDVSFLALLFLTSLTGFLLLALRESAAMGVLLALHLGVVMGLFVTLPYGKFVHAVYRFAALARNAAENRSGE